MPKWHASSMKCTPCSIFRRPAPTRLPDLPKKEDVEWAARVACGIDKLIQRFDLTGLAYYYRGLNNNAYERSVRP